MEKNFLSVPAELQSKIASVVAFRADKNTPGLNLRRSGDCIHQTKLYLNRAIYHSENFPCTYFLSSRRAHKKLSSREGFLRKCAYPGALRRLIRYRGASLATLASSGAQVRRACRCEATQWWGLVITTTQHIESVEARTSSPIRSRVGYSALQQVQAGREDVKVRDSDLHGREVVAKRRKRRKGHQKEMRP